MKSLFLLRFCLMFFKAQTEARKFRDIAWFTVNAIFMTGFRPHFSHHAIKGPLNVFIDCFERLNTVNLSSGAQRDAQKPLQVHALHYSFCLSGPHPRSSWPHQTGACFVFNCSGAEHHLIDLIFCVQFWSCRSCWRFIRHFCFIRPFMQCVTQL